MKIIYIFKGSQNAFFWISHCQFFRPFQFLSLSFNLMLEPVWPDVWVKSSPKVSKVAQKVATAVNILKSKVFQNSLKSGQSLGLLLLKSLLPRTFKNRPIWSHWTWNSLFFNSLSHEGFLTFPFSYSNLLV